jgi:hypothetical protein
MPVSTICPACGKSFTTSLDRVRRAPLNLPNCSRSCAFKNRIHPRLRHGQSIGVESKEFQAWMSMRNRCYKKQNKRYHRYGGRGISVCARWHIFENFLSDVGFAPSPKHTLGRIENDGNYEPGNVEWQTTKTQANNTSTNRLITAFRRTQTLAQWSDETGLSRNTIEKRIDRHGWSPEKAVSVPARAWNRKTVVLR